MPTFRATIRYGDQRPRYEMIDLMADDLRDALRAAADRIPDDVAASAELVELRRQTDPDAREYAEADRTSRPDPR